MSEEGTIIDEETASSEVEEQAEAMQSLPARASSNVAPAPMNIDLARPSDIPPPEVPTSDIEATAALLRSFGKDLKGHEVGKYDQSLVGAIQDGIKTIQEGLKIIPVDGVNTAANRAKIGLAVVDLNNTLKMAKVGVAIEGTKNVTLRKFKGVPANAPEWSQEELASAEKEFKAFVDFVDNIEKHMGHFEALEEHGKALQAHQEQLESQYTNAVNPLGQAFESFLQDDAVKTAVAKLATLSADLGAPDIYNADSINMDALLHSFPTVVNSYKNAFNLPQDGYFDHHMLNVARAIKSDDDLYAMAQTFLEVFEPLAGESNESPQGFLTTANTYVAITQVYEPELLQVSFGQSKAEKTAEIERQTTIGNIVKDLKADLDSMAGLVHDYSISSEVPLGFTMLPLDEESAEFGNAGRDALQQLIGTLRHTQALNINSDQGDAVASPLLYTKEFGERLKIELAQPQHSEIKAYFASVKPFTHPGTGAQYEGVESFVERLNYLNGIEGGIKQHYDPLPEIMPISDIQRNAIDSLYNKYNGTSMMPLVEVLTRDFTGGLGLAHFSDDPAKMREVQDMMAGLPVDPKERFKTVYKNAYMEHFKNGYDEIAHAKANKELLEIIGVLNVLPYGSAARRLKHHDMLKKTLSDAREHTVIENLSLDESANSFADLMLQHIISWSKTNGNPTPQADIKYGSMYDHRVVEHEIAFDPTLTAESMEKYGLLESGASKSDAAEKMEQIFEVYQHRNADTTEWFRKPLLFKEGGKVYIAGIDEDSNLFTVQPLELDKMQGIIEAEKELAAQQGREIDRVALDKALSDLPGYNFAMDNYATYFGDYTLQAGKLREETVLHGAQYAESLEKAAEIAGVGYARAKQNDRIVKNELSPAQYGGLQQRLENTIKRDLPNADQAKELLPYNQKPWEAYKGLADKPEFFIDSSGGKTLESGLKIYAFAARDPSEYKNDEDYFVVDLMDEINKYRKLSQSERDTIRDNGAEDDFPKLAAIAYQYPSSMYNHAYDVVDEILSKPELGLKAEFGAKARATPAAPSSPGVETSKSPQNEEKAPEAVGAAPSPT